MYIRDLFSSLCRRWYLVPVVVLLAVGGALLTADRVAPTYRASASVVLVPPETTLADTGNPYLFLGGLQQSVDVLSRTLGSEYIRETIKAQAPGGSYDVSSDVTTSAPIVLVTSEASSPEAADRLLSRVLGQVPHVLSRLQQSLSVRQKSQITTQVIARSQEPEKIQRGQYRAMVLAIGASLALGVLLVSLLDGLLLRRRGTRSLVMAPRVVRGQGGGG